MNGAWQGVGKGVDGVCGRSVWTGCAHGVARAWAGRERTLVTMSIPCGKLPCRPTFSWNAADAARRTLTSRSKATWGVAESKTQAVRARVGQ